MAFIITLVGCSQPVQFECGPEQYLLDAADEAGIDLPYSCRAGACTSCLCKVSSGSYDDADQSILDDDQQKRGFLAICVATPRSDITMQVSAESEL